MRLYFHHVGDQGARRDFPKTVWNEVSIQTVEDNIPLDNPWRAPLLRDLHTRFVYNRLFAFRGSFAVVPPSQDGCHASNEFPTFKVKPDVDKPELVAAYVVHCMNSPQYLQQVDRDSTGSTKQSRNRYKEDRFLKMPIPMPATIEQLEGVVGVLEKFASARTRFGELFEEVKRLNVSVSSLIPGPQRPGNDSSSIEVLARRKGSQGVSQEIQTTSKKGLRPAPKSAPKKRSKS